MGLTTGTCGTIIQVSCDVLIYLAASGFFALLYMRVPPRDSGFSCVDPSIRHEDRGDTVPPMLLAVVSLGAPITAILLLEFFHKVPWARQKHGRAPELCGAVGKLIGMFIYGLTLTMLLTEALKLAVGRLRPTFVYQCKPDFSKINCSQQYIMGVECTKDLREWEVYDLRKSFPSGHASLSFYSAVFLAIYLEHRMIVPFSTFLKSVIQFAGIGLALFCAGSRISDKRHHPEDAVTGGIIGSLMGIWTTYVLAKHLRQENCFVSNGGGVETVVYADPMVRYKREQSHLSNRSHMSTSHISEAHV